MNAQKWRDVWEETHAAMKELEASMEVASGLERAALIQERASLCSDGVARTLQMMRTSVEQVRRRVHAADVQLIAAVEALMADTILEEPKTHPKN